jgi:hypothetical protein
MFYVSTGKSDLLISAELKVFKLLVVITLRLLIIVQEGQNM